MPEPSRTGGSGIADRATILEIAQHLPSSLPMRRDRHTLPDPGGGCLVKDSFSVSRLAALRLNDWRDGTGGAACYPGLWSTLFRADKRRRSAILDSRFARLQSYP